MHLGGFLYLVVFLSLNLSTRETEIPSNDESEVLIEELSLESYLRQKYYAIDYSDHAAPSYEIFKNGYISLLALKEKKQYFNQDLLTLIDFNLSSNKKRMWVIDLKNKKLRFHLLVAHGKNTGSEFAENFSNTPNSNQSSLGMYLTGETYVGKHGMSLRLDGMEASINGNARKRAIVIHGAKYVSPSFTNAYGRIGRSFGCPAIPMENHKEVIQTLTGKTCLFIYHDSYKEILSTIEEKLVHHLITNQNFKQG